MAEGEGMRMKPEQEIVGRISFFRKYIIRYETIGWRLC